MKEVQKAKNGNTAVVSDLITKILPRVGRRPRELQVRMFLPRAVKRVRLAHEAAYQIGLVEGIEKGRA